MGGQEEDMTEAQEEGLLTQMLKTPAMDDESYVGTGMNFVKTFSTINVNPRPGC